ncbi:MAG: phosphate acyltransferase PlsX [Candidatus Omnitrophica bacterium]|nr:phosphate acyltransferase PlsX [Candidatus Omnitrophota bacterium]MCM8797885.1 phosphate acyltransferase PlsX [Candidatus Omnitrophota bacterium]
MKSVRMAVDAMGSDRAPQVEIEGAVLAVNAGYGEVILVGNGEILRKELKKYKLRYPERITVQHAPEVIGMDEPPAISVRRKKNSSIMIAADLVKEGRADALISAGNTGAVVCATTLAWGLIPGIERPGIAIVFPTLEGTCILIDAGANIDPKPSHLYQYAIMGAVYAREILGKDNPRVGLLNIGEEETKGTDFVKETHRLLSKSRLNFIGNVEGGDIFRGKAEVIVCDGFVGNVALKISESLAYALTEFLRRHIQKSNLAKLGAFFLKGTFKNLKKEIDYAEYGGAPLLGVNGVCTICHGASSYWAIKNALKFAFSSIKNDIKSHIEKEIEYLGERG